MAAYQNHAVPGLLVLSLPWTEVLLTTSEPGPPQLMGLSLMVLLLFGRQGSTEAPGSAAPLIRPQSRQAVIYGRGGGRGAIQTSSVNNSPSSARHKNKQSGLMLCKPRRVEPAGERGGYYQKTEKRKQSRKRRKRPSEEAAALTCVTRNLVIRSGSLLFSLDRIISSMSPCSFSMTTKTRSGVSNMHSRLTMPGWCRF